MCFEYLKYCTHLVPVNLRCVCNSKYCFNDSCNSRGHQRPTPEHGPTKAMYWNLNQHIAVVQTVLKAHFSTHFSCRSFYSATTHGFQTNPFVTADVWRHEWSLAFSRDIHPKCKFKSRHHLFVLMIWRLLSCKHLRGFLDTFRLNVFFAIISRKIHHQIIILI